MKNLVFLLALVSSVSACYSSARQGGQDGGDEGQACAEGLTACYGECVNLEADPGNCGICGFHCGEDETCLGGSCRSPCMDECVEEGSWRCALSPSNYVELCRDGDGDGCLEWSDLSPCPVGETCSGGICTSGCLDLCGGGGQQQCSDDGEGVEICGDFNLDGCLEWSSIFPCRPGEICIDGRCERGDPYCGNERCDGSESCETCPEDCGACPYLCGNGVCDEGESCADCSEDCGECIRGCEPLRWDLGAEFSASENPSGAWTYGWTESDGSGFALMTAYERDRGPLDWWGGWRASDGNPSICYNGTGADYIGFTVLFEAGAAAFHPGPGDERAVARWTAPTDGTYWVRAHFYSMDPGATDVEVIAGSLLVHHADLDYDWSESTFEDALELSVGDNVDSTIGYGSDGGFYGDTTGIAMSVRRMNWDLARDFSAECNSTGAWSYGSTATLGSFDAFDFVFIAPDTGCSIWSDTEVPADGYAHVWKNTSSGWVTGVEPGEFSMHPGCYGFTEPCGSQWAVVRWTSNFSGEVTISGSFDEGDSATPDLDIARTSASVTTILWHRENTALTEPFDLASPVEPGDFIDFVVGDAYYFGNTPLMATITRLDTGD